jgi:hypothetical protein
MAPRLIMPGHRPVAKALGSGGLGSGKPGSISERRKATRIPACPVNPSDKATVSDIETRSKHWKGDEIAIELKRLETVISELKLPAYSVVVLNEDLEKLSSVSRKTPEDKAAVSGILEGLISKLKMVGVAVQAVTSLHDPLVKIAQWFGVQLPI